MIHSANSITCTEINRDNVLLFNSLSLNSQFNMTQKKTFPHDCEKALCTKYNLSLLVELLIKKFLSNLLYKISKIICLSSKAFPIFKV